jgi:hypothetical protein
MAEQITVLAATDEARKALEPLDAPGFEDGPAAAQPRPVGQAGPLVAVCALCGGAGASTLAYLLARHVARPNEQPVLVGDTGGPTGGLAAYARTESPRSLPRVANAIAAYEPFVEGLFAEDSEYLRVIATAPNLESGADPGGLGRLLNDARAAHQLTVVDCGVPEGRTEVQVLEAATHVIWILPATGGGVRRAARVLRLFEVGLWQGEAVLARQDGSEHPAPMDELARLADLRRAPLVLMPHVPDLLERSPDSAMDAASSALEAIEMLIRRSASRD